jgi:hypothetical protein
MATDDKPNLQEIILRVTLERMRGVDPEDMDPSWEVGFHIEGAVFDYIWDNLPRGYSRDLVEQVLALVDWAKVCERATYDLPEETIEVEGTW